MGKEGQRKDQTFHLIIQAGAHRVPETQTVTFPVALLRQLRGQGCFADAPRPDQGDGFRVGQQLVTVGEDTLPLDQGRRQGWLFQV
jgi:hypothetical protein